MKKIIVEEIERINELLGIQPNLITEQYKFLSEIGSELWSLVKKAEPGFKQKDIDDLVTKGKRDGVEALTDNELTSLAKHLNLTELAKKYWDKGKIISKNTQLNTINGNIKRILDKGAASYPETVETLRKNASKDFFGLIPDFDEKYNEFAESFAEIIIENIDTKIKETYPELWKEISIVLQTPLKNSIASKFKLDIGEFINELGFENLQTITRILLRTFQKQDKLRKEFIDVAQQMADVAGTGQNTKYYEKKLADILSSAKKTYKQDARNTYKIIKRDPSFPKGDMVRDFEASEYYTDLMSLIKQRSSFVKIIKEDALEWLKLFDLKKFFTLESLSRWWRVILKLNPVTFKQTAKRLQQRGVQPMLIRQLYGAYILKYLLYPAVYTLVRTLAQLIGEFGQFFVEIFGTESPIDPVLKDDSWRDMIKESFFSAIPDDLRVVLPWNSLIDNIIFFAVNNDKTSAEDFIDNATEEIEDSIDNIDDDETRNELDSLRTQGETRLNLQNTDIPIELLEALDGELDYLKEKVYKKDNSESYLINRPDGERALQLSLIDNEWKIETIDRNGVIGYEKLINDKVIKSLKKLIPKTQSETVLNKSKKMLEEQLQIDDGPEDKEPIVVDDPENEFDEKIKKVKDKISAIKNSQTALIAKEYWDELWAEIEKKSAEGKNQLKILLLKQELDKKSSKVLPAGATMSFVDCTGWNTLGCKSESIKKLQTCLNVGASGNFDEYLKKELARYPFTYAFINGFNDSDVQKICNFREAEDENNLIKQEMLARDVMKSSELNAFLKKYPKGTTLATGRDEF